MLTWGNSSQASLRARGYKQGSGRGVARWMRTPGSQREAFLSATLGHISLCKMTNMPNASIQHLHIVWLLGKTDCKWCKRWFGKERNDANRKPNIHRGIWLDGFPVLSLCPNDLDKTWPQRHWHPECLIYRTIASLRRVAGVALFPVILLLFSFQLFKSLEAQEMCINKWLQDVSPRFRFRLTTVSTWASSLTYQLHYFAAVPTMARPISGDQKGVIICIVMMSHHLELAHRKREGSTSIFSCRCHIVFWCIWSSVSYDSRTSSSEENVTITLIKSKRASIKILACFNGYFWSMRPIYNYSLQSVFSNSPLNFKSMKTVTA